MNQSSEQQHLSSSGAPLQILEDVHAEGVAHDLLQKVAWGC